MLWRPRYHVLSLFASPLWLDPRRSLEKTWNRQQRATPSHLKSCWRHLWARVRVIGWPMMQVRHFLNERTFAAKNATIVAHPKMLKISSFLQLLFWEVTFHPIINRFSPPSRTWRSRQRSSAALPPRSYRRSSRTWSFPRWMCRQSLGRWMGFRKETGRRFFSPFWDGWMDHDGSDVLGGRRSYRVQLY